jgi:hypothetical protein
MADLGTAVLNNADRNTRAANTPATITEANHTQPRHLESKPEQQGPPHTSNHSSLASASGTQHQQHIWHNPQQRQPDPSIDPRLHNPAPPHTHMSLLNPMSSPAPGQHPTSSERADRVPIANVSPASNIPTDAPANPNATAPTAPGGFDFSEASPDWLNFDAAFENFEGLLGSSGADLSIELFRPLHYEGLDEF